MSTGTGPSDQDQNQNRDSLVESTTITPADVVIHAHPWQQIVDVVSEHVDVQLVASRVTVNGAEFHNPNRALTLSDAEVTHLPDENQVEIRVLENTTTL